MRQQTCESCGRPFAPPRPRVRRCSHCQPAGRAAASPTTRAQNAEYQRNRRLILADGPPCHWCPAPATTADHLIPVARGGTNRRENLVPACAVCNSSRQANPDWRPAHARPTHPPAELSPGPATPRSSAPAGRDAPPRAPRQGSGPLTIA